VALECIQCGNAFRIRRSRASAKFCSFRCYNLARSGNETKYVCTSRNGKSVRRHRVVMEEKIGRALLTAEHVHHADRDRSNNRENNLSIESVGSHRRLHIVGGSARVIGMADRSMPPRSGDV